MLSDFIRKENPGLETQLIILSVLILENNFEEFKNALTYEVLFYQSPYSGNRLLTYMLEYSSSFHFLHAIVEFLPKKEDRDRVLNTKDNYGMSPLRAAHHPLTPEFPKYLLENGADPNESGLRSRDIRDMKQLCLLLKHGLKMEYVLNEFYEFSHLWYDVAMIERIQLIQILISPKDVKRICNINCKLGLLSKDVFRELIKFL